MHKIRVLVGQGHSPTSARDFGSHQSSEASHEGAPTVHNNFYCVCALIRLRRLSEVAGCGLQDSSRLVDQVLKLRSEARMSGGRGALDPRDGLTAS